MGGARHRRLQALPALGLVVAAGWVVLAVAAALASVPRFFFDELYYMEAGVSLGQGDGLAFRGEDWGFGAVYPSLISVLVRLTADQETTYTLVKLLNVTCFTLAAIPTYLLARRVLAARPALAIAGLAIVLPSSMYVSVSMTESVGYLCATSALAASVLALERPTVSRQVAALLVMVVAIGTRPQLVSLLVGHVAALAFVLARPGSRGAFLGARRFVLWPTAAAVAAGLVLVVRAAFSSDGLGGLLGDYDTLARDYSPWGVAWWALRHVGDLALYTGIVPVAAAPAAVALLLVRGRAGEPGARAVALVAVAQALAALIVVGAFASTEFGQGLLYDRYLFFLVPTMLAVTLAWLLGGRPWSRRTAVAGAALALSAVSVLPYDSIGEEHWFKQFQAVATEIWGKLGTVADRLPLVSLLGIGVTCAIAAAALTFLAPERFRGVLPAVVLIVLGGNLTLAWRSAFVDPAIYGLPPKGERSWVDGVLPSEARAFVLLVGRSCDGEVARFAGIETEYFNRTVSGLAGVGGGAGGDAPGSLTVAGDGTIRYRTGGPLTVDYVVAPPGVELEGVRLATSLGAGLVLWQVDGRVQARTARSDRELAAGPC